MLRVGTDFGPACAQYSLDCWRRSAGSLVIAPKQEDPARHLDRDASDAHEVDAFSLSSEKAPARRSSPKRTVALCRWKKWMVNRGTKPWPPRFYSIGRRGNARRCEVPVCTENWSQRFLPLKRWLSHGRFHLQPSAIEPVSPPKTTDFFTRVGNNNARWW